jgi:hypothetical protein
METSGAIENFGRADGAARVSASVLSHVDALAGGGDGAAAAFDVDRRKHVREKVLKAAKIIFGGGDSIYNCLVLDESPEGIFVDMGAIVALPPEVTIQFNSGAAFRAVRRWSTGSKIGFQFVGPQIINHETARRMQLVSDIMKNHGLPAAMQTLRVAQYFDNMELRRAAEAAEAATSRLDAVLAGAGAMAADVTGDGSGYDSLGGGSRV